MLATERSIAASDLAEALPKLAQYCEANPGILKARDQQRFCGGIRVSSQPEGGQTLIGFYADDVTVTLFFDSSGSLNKCIGANGAVASSVGHENYQRGAMMIARDLGLMR